MQTTRYAHIWLVPLIRESPSLACSTNGTRPACSSAEAEDCDTQIPPFRTMHFPSPIIPRAICDNGARSPDAPSEPILGITGAIPALIIPKINSTTSGRQPEYPVHSVFARINIIIKTCSGCILSPTPQAWLRMRLYCNSSSWSCSMVTLDRAPNPVLIPYTTSPLSRILSTADLLADIALRAVSSVSNTAEPSPASITSRMLNEQPLSNTVRLPIGFRTTPSIRISR